MQTGRWQSFELEPPDLPVRNNYSIIGITICITHGDKIMSSLHNSNPNLSQTPELVRYLRFHEQIHLFMCISSFRSEVILEKKEMKGNCTAKKKKKL